jgi:SAM-dependent methyltransferase
VSALDLYADIEGLLGFEDEIAGLYDAHALELARCGATTALDIGCGNGNFVRKLCDSGFDACGVDLSVGMIERAKNHGVNARCVDICALEGESYSAATAVFDVLNYIEDSALDRFFECVRDILAPNGIFVADVNTLYGFEEVAQGDARFFDDTRELFVSADFDGDALTTSLTLFEQKGELYAKRSGQIVQYYHDKKRLKNISALRLEKTVPLKLFGDQADKELLVFRRLS